MPRDPAKQKDLEERLSRLRSKSYSNYNAFLKMGTYRKNRDKWAKNRANLLGLHRTITNRMNRGKSKIGNNGKKEKLGALIEMMNQNTNAENSSPRVNAASVAAQGNAVQLAEKVAGSAPAEVAVVTRPVVEIEEKVIRTLVPGDIPRLQKISDVLSDLTAQKDLIGLYSDSQAEFTRNGSLTMEIGMSRERDLLAVLQEYIGDEFRTDIDNSLIEDCVYGTARISIKHVSSKLGTGSVKAKWTSDAGQARSYIDKMLALDPASYTHIMIVYIDTKSETSTTITAVLVTDRTIMDIVERLKEGAFVSKPGTNNRGVEYSRAMISDMIKNAAFTVKIDNVSLKHGIDPIARRRALIIMRRQESP